MNGDDWSPLEKLIGSSRRGCFMYMGQSRCVFHRDGWEPLRLYKHIDTRRYLNVAEDGTCFRYSEGGYTPISAEVAIEHAFRWPENKRLRAGNGAEEGGETQWQKA